MEEERRLEEEYDEKVRMERQKREEEEREAAREERVKQREAMKELRAKRAAEREFSTDAIAQRHKEKTSLVGVQYKQELQNYSHDYFFSLSLNDIILMYPNFYI